MHVLHLFDAAEAEKSGCDLALLFQGWGRMGEHGQSLILLGGSHLRETVALVNGWNTESKPRGGWEDRGVYLVGMPMGKAVMALAGAKRVIKSLVLGEPDVVHCWSLQTLLLAMLMRPKTPRILTLTQVPDKKTLHWLRLCAGEAKTGFGILAISDTIAKAVLSGGISDQIVQVIYPGLDLAMVVGATRSQLRQEWKVEKTDGKSNSLVVGLFSDPPGKTDTMEAVMAVGLAEEVLGRPIYLLVHGKQKNRLGAKKALREVRGENSRLIVDRRIDLPWLVLPGCDLVLAMGEHAGGLSLRWAMAGNVPIVAEVGYAVSEVVEDHHSALLGKPKDAIALARRIEQMATDERLAWRLRDTARHEAFSFFSRQRYVQNMQKAYEQVAARQPITIPRLEPTGGLRFSPPTH